MGEPGKFARVLGPVMGNVIDFARPDLEEQSAPGQLAISELVDVYHYPDLNRETAIYGLIGNPVVNSPGHLYHNGVFRSRSLNAVYVKMEVGPEELSDFILLAKKMGIRGLSVTAPLKEKIIPFLDGIDPGAEKIGAINTLLFKEGQILGTNTDGCGALDAMEKKISVNGRRVVVLGAGGVARAIAFEARARGAELMILNRTVERAEELAGVLGCRAGRLDEMPSDYDIIINCSSGPMPIDAKKMRPQVLAMDVMCFPKETAFLKEAQKRGCQIVYGEEMYVNQAAGQSRFWMDG
jgi:3-dehydroquinate dehydratase/shikimate dehydrogenase